MSNVIEEGKTFHYHKLGFRYNAKKIQSAYMVECGEIDEREFAKKYPTEYWGKVIKYFEDDMYSLCNLKHTDYELVKGIDLSKDGIYIENFEYKLFAVVIGGELVLQIEQ